MTDTRGAKIEQAVFDFLRPKLKQYRQQTDDLARATATSIAKVVAHAEAVVVERRRQLKRAQDELDCCLAQENANCSGYFRQVELCQRALQDAIRGRALIHEAADRFRHAQSKHTSSVDQLLLRAQKLVRVADERTTGYQKRSIFTPSATTLILGTSRSGSAGSVGSFIGGGVGTSSAEDAIDATGIGRGGAAPTAEPVGGWQNWPGVEIPARFPGGFALVPISLIVDDNPVTWVQNFDAGQDLRALTWATDALLDVVLPAMVKVDDPRQYLRDRDVRENLCGDASYSATYSGFFSEDTAIRLSPLDNGTFDLQNGHHRLWLLSRAGVQSVPAYVRGAAR